MSTAKKNIDDWIQQLQSNFQSQVNPYNGMFTLFLSKESRRRRLGLLLVVSINQSFNSMLRAGSCITSEKEFFGKVQPVSSRGSTSGAASAAGSAASAVPKKMNYSKSAILCVEFLNSNGQMIVKPLVSEVIHIKFTSYVANSNSDPPVIEKLLLFSYRSFRFVSFHSSHCKNSVCLQQPRKISQSRHSPPRASRFSEATNSSSLRAKCIAVRFFICSAGTIY